MIDFIPDTERVVAVDGHTYEVHRYFGRLVLYGVFERDEDGYREGFLTLQNVSYTEHDGEPARKRYLRGHRAIRLAFPEAAVGKPHLARIQAYEEDVLDVEQPPSCALRNDWNGRPVLVRVDLLEGR